MVKPRDSDRSERRGCVPLESYLGLLTAANVVLCAVLKIATWNLIGFFLAVPFYLPVLIIFSLTTMNSILSVSKSERGIILAPVLWANCALSIGFLLQIDGDGIDFYVAILRITIGMPAAQQLVPEWSHQYLLIWNIWVLLPAALMLLWLHEAARSGTKSR